MTQLVRGQKTLREASIPHASKHIAWAGGEFDLVQRSSNFKETTTDGPIIVLKIKCFCFEYINVDTERFWLVILCFAIQSRAVKRGP